MPPKRKRAEVVGPSGPIIYASEVPWLRFLTHNSDKVSHDDLKEVETNKEHMIAACKFIYLLYHKIEDHLPLVLQSLNDGLTTTDAEITKTARLQQSLWKGTILNKFFLSHVNTIRQQWRVAHAYASFEAALEDSEREKFWLEAYDADPKGTVYAMFKPIAEVLDLSRIYNSDGLPEPDQTKMKAVRRMLFEKYMFGCRLTYSTRVCEDMRTKKPVAKKEKCFADWTNFANIDDNASVMVSIEDLPISAAFLDDLATRSQHASKKLKQESMLVDIHDADSATTSGSVPQIPEPSTIAPRSPKPPTAKQSQEGTKKAAAKHIPYSLEFFTKRPRDPKTLDEFFGGARDDDQPPATLEIANRPTSSSKADDESA